MIDQKFRKQMQEKKYFQNHRKVLVAVSGGLDSMTLFHLLYQNRAELEIELGIAHVNHKQRPESNMEEKELSNFAQQLGVKFFSSNFSGDFSEEKARRFRYRFFEEIMLTEGYTALVTAHHADDQAETVFMRLIRGARLRHLSGMTEVQPFANGELIRPLLCFHKQDFPDILHFEDESNFQNDYLRNRIRNLYLPSLEKENPRFKDSLISLGKEVEELQVALSHLTQGLDITKLEVFERQIPEVQNFLLQEYLKEFPSLNLTKKQFAEILGILRTKANYIHPLKDGYELVKDYKHFEIRKISRRSDLKMESILLECGNLLQFGEYQFSFGSPLEGENVQAISVSRETPILLRHRKTGDFLRLKGHHKKLRRLFIDQKIPFEEREKAIIVEQNHQILAIVNIAISDLSKELKSDIMSTVLYIQKLDR
ncbi:tRNA(Ile)-lysidine synthetase [Streptococcus cristatus]|uniref:tRNA(Ile)-lysidine synthase n=2 Tax=Streptococcus cristatus TaxID=45634 RepID=A0A512ADQ4_STRCR|nr:tRNA lysidine(34) synthetase TilS [Streptococcus cristatus]AGK70152.1 tRNA(Ile)-lysidine synthetase [Streptococcus cristatus AS 1.3089]GEN97816.1 tRNA(Ile)-lysidine synthase [Streptococcus cristatus]SQI45260.1 tRNA(Ile)-lysidine synthetase [Streptococcus cristatus]